VADLEAQLGVSTPARAKIDRLSAEVIDSNPYSCVADWPVCPPTYALSLAPNRCYSAYTHAVVNTLCRVSPLPPFNFDQ